MSEVNAIREFVDQVENYWTDHGMKSTDRRRLAAELERDLDEAVRQGAAVVDLIEEEVGRFARELAVAGGVVLREPAALTMSKLVKAGVVGGLAGAAFAWFLLLPGLAYIGLAGSGPAVVVLALVAAAAVTVGGVVGGVASRFPRGQRPRRLLALTGLFTVIAGLVGVVPIKLVAMRTGYSTAPVILLLEAGMGAAFVAVAVAAAGRLGGFRARTSG